MAQVITNDLNSKGVGVVKLHEQLIAERSTWDYHWDQVAKYVIPKKDNVYGQNVPGEKKSNLLFDTMAIAANDDLAAALHGMLTNPSFIWFGMATGVKELDSDEDCRRWLFDSTRKTIQVMNQSNFQTEIHEVYQDLGSIGTASLRIEADPDTIVRYYSEPVYQVVLRENNRGIIDFVSREYEYDGRQVLMEFEDSIDPETEQYVRDMLKSNPGYKFKIIQQVSKRTRAEMDGQIGSMAYPYASIHVMKCKSAVLRESGFEVFPFATPRWSKINVETYGRSPAMKALADIKMANQMKKVTIQGAQLAIAPPLQIPDNGFLTPVQARPFGTNYYRAGSRDRIEPLFTGANPQLGEVLIEMVHASINKHFMTDKLNTPMQDRMTATEIMQRRDEQLRFMGPQLGRMDTELLKPVIDRTFYLCDKAGIYDELPEKLATYVQENGGNLSLLIEYRSTIAQAQLMAQAENTVRAINATGTVIGFNPSIMDNIDGDKLLKDNFKTYNVNPEILRTSAEVAQIRQQRQEQAAAQAERDNAGQDAETIKTLGEANVQQ